MQRFDVLIIGAGPAGLCFARALVGSGLSVALVEQQARSHFAEPAFDGREIALTHASRQVMQQLGLWEKIPEEEISPLRDARVMNGSSPFALTFADAKRDGGDLGWLVPNHLIRRAAWQAVQQQEGLHIIDEAKLTALQVNDADVMATLSSGETISARLLVAADSRFSTTRRMLGIGARMRDFGKTMLVCRMNHELPHHHEAWEWFGYGRTMALLPLHGNRAGAVLTMPPRGIEALMVMDENEFGKTVSGFYEHRLGNMTLTGTRHAYPLVAVYANRFVGQRSALIGDAAVGMHPVTAHGFNFGLQSVARLSNAVLAAASAGRDIASPSLLSAYERSHRRASLPLYEATNAIAALYTDDRAPAKLLRNGALRAARFVTPFRRVIASHLTQREVAGVRAIS
jgi:ubiquinone biosynthesis UbiH/UbiF/VisC/COQ6 family hydroxylase